MTALGPDEFDEIIKRFTVHTPDQHEHIDPTPYGTPHTVPTPRPAARPGLTTRGKAALGIGAAVIAGGSLLGYQAYSANTAQAEVKAQELALKASALELAKLREEHRVADADRKVQNTAAKTRQASVDACVKDMKDQVGKGLGSPTYRDVVEACQTQYPDTVTGAGMENAAAESSTPNNGGGGVNDGALIGCVVLVAGLAIAVKKGKRTPETA